MSEYKFNNGFIYRKDFKLPMTRVVEILNEMYDQLNHGSEEYKELFEAFEDGQRVLKDANARLENLSRVNNEYKEVLTPIWDYSRKNVKVELGKSITEALIESHKLLQSQVWSLEQRCKLLEEDAEDTAKYVEIQRGELAKANERVRDLEKDLTVSNGFIAKKMPIVFAISGKNKGAKLVYEEAVKVLNKFAIEKKIEELDLIVELAHSIKGGISTIDIANRAHELSKQLRKEQDDEV